jgi:hypothetical protein
MTRTPAASVRRLLGEVGVPLLLLCALDLGFGWYVVRTSTVPVPRLFGPDPITSGKFLVFRERVRHEPALDVASRHVADDARQRPATRRRS